MFSRTVLREETWCKGGAVEEGAVSEVKRDVRVETDTFGWERAFWAAVTMEVVGAGGGWSWSWSWSGGLSADWRRRIRSWMEDIVWDG